MAQAEARSFEVMTIGETLSPARAGRRPSSPAGEDLDPGRAGVVAADEAVEDVEGLGQDMVARQRLELGYVERLQHAAQLFALGRGAAAGPCAHRVAGVEDHEPATLHIGFELAQGLGRGDRAAGHDRPVQHREEGELVAVGIEADSLAGFERGARAEHDVEAGKAGL